MALEQLDIQDFCYNGKGDFRLDEWATGLDLEKELKATVKADTALNVKRIAELQDRFYADGREGVVILLQALDAAGKDSTIKHVMSGVNPQGVEVTSFKNPTSIELAHDYMWRANLALPTRGQIGIFNRSYYEDVLVVRVHGFWKGYKWPERCCSMGEDEFFAARYRQIADYERYLYENGYRVLKLFLNVGRDAQKKRFLERIEDPAKNWKFSESDLAERALWPEYQKAFQTCIDATSTDEAPWYVIPADQKWVMQNLVSQAVIKVLEACDSRYPEMPEEQQAKLASYREVLLAE